MSEERIKRLFIETYGCQMNVADSEVIASIMRMAGFDPTENIDEADAIFLNTCSIRENAEQKIWNRLEALNAIKKKNKAMIIGVMGCMAERTQEDLINVVAKVNPNTIVVITAGSPIDFRKIEKTTPVIVWSWFNGVTETAKGALHVLPRRTQALYRLCDDFVGVEAGG